MGHFYKKLILSGIFAVATAGLFSTTNTSALGGSLLDSEFTEPFSFLNNDSSEDPTLPSSDDPFPTLLYNRISDGETLWGYDGEGIVFADSDGLVDGNPHLKTAKRGDTLTFSVKIEPERYYDDAETEPFAYYALSASMSQGLTLDPASIVLKVGDQVIPVESNDINDYGGEAGMGFYLSKQIYYSQTSQGTTTFNYPEGAIELTYSATIDSDAPSQLFSRASYSAYTNNYSKSISSGSALYGGNGYQLDVLLDGRIIIRRVDANNQPLAGAKFTIDGVKANANQNGTYSYDGAGSVSEFVTDANGVIVINGAPFGTYVAKEVSSPAGHEVLVSTISKDIGQEIQGIETGKQNYRLNVYNIDITSSVVDIDKGKIALGSEMANIIGGDNYEATAMYDESLGGYSLNGKLVKKTTDGYQLISDNEEPVDFVYDSTINKYLVSIDYVNSNESLQIDVNNNGEAVLTLGNTTMTLPLNQDTGCYEGFLQEENADVALCPDGESDYYLIEDIHYSSFIYGVAMRYIYDEDLDKYYMVIPERVVAIEETSDSGLRLSQNWPIVKIPQTGKYYVAGVLGGDVLWLLNTAPQTILGTEFLFRDKASGSDNEGSNSDGSSSVPEDIANPQTGDSLMVVIGVSIATVLLASRITRNYRKRI